MELEEKRELATQVMETIEDIREKLELIDKLMFLIEDEEEIDEDDE